MPKRKLGITEKFFATDANHFNSPNFEQIVMALLICAAFDIDAEPLLAMHTRYDMIMARRNKTFSQKLNSIRINTNQGDTPPNIINH